MANHNSNWLRICSITKTAKAICESKPGEVFPAAAGVFFEKKELPEIPRPVEVLLAAAGAFFSAKMAFLEYYDMY